MTEGIYLLLGSNMGDKRLQLAAAIQKISRNNRVIKCSEIYETAAWGNPNQPSFYNQVIQIKTTFEPIDLLDHLLNTEEEMGRVREEKWGERIIDIDILYYNDRIIETDKLSIPHPEIQNRRFTLIPLIEIAPEYQHPILRKNQKELLDACDDHLEVTFAKNV